jgi:hypothetical protein
MSTPDIVITHILRRIRPSHSQRKALTGSFNLLRCPLSNGPTVIQLVRHLGRQQTSRRPISTADTLASYQVLPGLHGQRTRLLTRPILNVRGYEPPQRLHVPSVTRQLHVMSPSSPAVARRTLLGHATLVATACRWLRRCVCVSRVGRVGPCGVTAAARVRRIWAGTEFSATAKRSPIYSLHSRYASRTAGHGFERSH